MQQVSAQYLQILQNQAQTYKVRYLAIFKGIPVRFSTGPITQPQGRTLGYMQIPTGAGAQITPDQGSSSFSSLNVRLVDYDQQVTALMRSYQMLNLQVTVKQGFEGMPESAYCTIATGLVQTFKLTDHNMVWQFNLTSLMNLTQTNIFDAFATLTAPLGAGDSTMYVDSTSGFPQSTNGVCYLFTPAGEVISYTGITPGSFTGLGWAQLGTVAASGNAGDQPTNLIVLEGPPLTLALQIMLSTGNGTNGPYDVLPACAGMAIPQNLINAQAFLTQQQQWLAGLTFRFEESTSILGTDFLEQQIFQFSNSYPITDNYGMINVHVYGPPMPSAETAIVNDENMTGPPVWSDSVLGRYFFNEVQLLYDYNFQTGNYDQSAFYEDGDSQEEFGTTVTWQNGQVQSRGLRSAVAGGLAINNWAQRLLARFGGASAPVEAELMFNQRQISIGDIVPMTSDFLPDLTTGTIGVDAHLYEVIELTPDYMKGTQKLTMLDTGVMYGKKYCAITPAGFPQFQNASSYQKNWGFICTATGATSGKMLDGSDGYYITA